MKRYFVPWVLVAGLGMTATATHAQFDPARMLVEPAAIAERYPDPKVSYPTPGLREGRTDFPSHAEVFAFLDGLARKSKHLRVETIGHSQRGLAMAMLVLSATGQPDPGRPTVMVMGQQHGNEPSGGEAALVLAQQLAGPRSELLDHVNVLIVPRANPDGAEGFTRVTAGGIDVNRDHLLLQTPEARALAAATLRHRPQVVMDLHEFTVGGRWVEKFGAMEKYDALLQPAAVGNLDPAITEVAQSQFVDHVQSVLRAQGLLSFRYHTTSNDAKDKTVSMGGVQPDTGRNVSGLRPAISLLIEVRGVGLGRAHFLRRVHTQALAALTVVETAAGMGQRLVKLVHEAEVRSAAQACRGDMVIEARLSPTRQMMEFLDAKTGADLPVEVDWRAATPLQVVRSRPRPCGYLLAANQEDVISRLRLLGVRVQPVTKTVSWDVERYVVTAEDDGQRQDSRGAIEDAQPIRALQVRTERGKESVGAGLVYIGLDQPLAPLIAAAMEPDSQNSYVANRLLDLEPSQLRRVMRKPPAALLRAR